MISSACCLHQNYEMEFKYTQIVVEKAMDQAKSQKQSYFHSKTKFFRHIFIESEYRSMYDNFKCYILMLYIHAL